MKIIQYLPGYFEGFENEEVEFSTTKELLEIPFVKNFNYNDFSGYAISMNHLMATYENGTHWLVVGILSHPSSVKLPRWEKNKPGGYSAGNSKEGEKQ